MRKSLSIVIPIFNEAESLEILYKQIIDVLTKKLPNYRYEILFVDDGSTDRTLTILKRLKKKNNRIRILSFRRNYGKAAALNVGFSKAKGSILITMDGDLQDGPENIPLLVRNLNKDTDLVVGWKKQRFDPLGKTIPSKAFNYFVGKFSGVELHDFNSGFKAMKIEAARELYLYGELHRFVPVLVSQKGFKVSEVVVSHHPRIYGKSKYGWSRLIKGLFDFLTVLFLGRFGHRPLHFFGILGLLCVFFGMGFGLFLLRIWLAGGSIGTRPMINLVVLLQIAGLQLLSIGLIAEMLVNRLQKSDAIPVQREF